MNPHWRTHPKAWRCQHGHGYSHPKEGRMSLFLGGSSVLITFMCCHQCQPRSFQIGAIYNVKPDPMAFWYSVPSQQIFDELRVMDDEGIPLADMLDYLDSCVQTEAA